MESASRITLLLHCCERRESERESESERERARARERERESTRERESRMPAEREREREKTPPILTSLADITRYVCSNLYVCHGIHIDIYVCICR